MLELDSSYKLELGVRETYLFAGILPAESETSTIDRVIRVPKVRSDLSRRVLIENYLDEPIKLWEVLPVVVTLMKAGCECLEVAVVDPRVPPETARDLNIYFGPEKAAEVRIFENEAAAETWFAEFED